MTARTTMQSVLWGAGAAAGLLLLFALAVRTFSGAWGEVRFQFEGVGVYLIVLAIGFGIQIGLWRYLKMRHAAHMKTRGVPAVSGATSGIAMLACCSHYVANVLPFVGLVGIAGFLTQYQVQVLTASIGLNLLGIAYMAYQLQMHRRAASGLACHSSTET